MPPTHKSSKEESVTCEKEILEVLFEVQRFNNNYLYDAINESDNQTLVVII